MAATLGTATLATAVDLEGLDEGLDEGRGKTEGWLSSLGGSVSSILGGAVLGGVALVTGAVIGIGAAAFSAGMVVDDAMDTIVIATGATGAELASLEESFGTVFSSVPTDAGTAATVVGALNQRLGITGEELDNLAIPLVQVSELLGGDAATNTELFTRVMGDWGVAVGDGAGLLDTFFVASQNTGAGLDSLMQQVVQFGSPLRLMGFSLEESIAMFAQWEQQGVNAELVMGSLRIAAGNFADANIPLRDGLNQTMEAIMGAATESEALAIAMDVFGARAGPDMAAAILEGRFAIEDLLAVMDDSEGAIMETAAATMDFGEMWTLAKNHIMLALEPIGAMMIGLANDAMPLIVGFIQEHLIPAIEMFITHGVPAIQEFGAQAMTWIIGTLLPALQDFGNWFLAEGWPAIQSFTELVMSQLIPGLQQLWTWGQQIAAVLLPLLAQGWEWVTNNMNIVLPILGVIGGAILILNAPIAAIIAGVVLLATAWANNWGDIQGKTQAATEFIQNIISTVLGTIQGFWDAHGAAVIGAVQGFMATVQGSIQTAVNFIQGIVNTALTLIRGWWQQHGDMVMTLVNTAFTYIRNTIDNALQFVTGIWLAFKAAREGDWTAFGEHLRTAWDAVWQQVQNVLTAAQTAIGTIVQEIIETAVGWFESLKERGPSLVSQTIEDIKGFFLNTDWGALGTSLIQGIANGITAASGFIMDAVQNALQAALDAATGFLDSGSPARNPAIVGLGSSFVQGVGVGMAEEKETLQASIVDPLALSLNSLMEIFRDANGKQGATQPRNGQTLTNYGGLHVYGVQDGMSLLEQLQGMT